jgi:hypothetical protein
VLFGVAAESCQVEFDALGGPGSGDWRGCLLAPLHTNTALFAKQAASLDRISGGRLVLGLGIGGWDGGREARRGTKFSDYLAESEAADSPEAAAVRAMFAAGIALGLQFRDARVSRGLTRAYLSGLTASRRLISAVSSVAPATRPSRRCSDSRMV